MLENTTERDIHKVRLRFLDLIKSFFYAEPDAETMSRWRGTFSALCRENVNPTFDRAVHALSDRLEAQGLSELQEEYYRLFTDPYSKTPLSLLGSYYLDGRAYGQSLVELRSLLREAGLQREKGVLESEDSLVMMLDIMASLVEEEKNGGGERLRKLQSRLLAGFLEPFASSLLAEAKKNENAVFYKDCCMFLLGYLDLEKGLVATA